MTRGREMMRLRQTQRRKRRTSLAMLSKSSFDQIARIDALTAAGRANWFALLAYLAFVTVTTLGVEDVDFFIDSRQTDLPLVGVSIPTFSFFVFAPILGAALYAYLHLHVRKVSEALAETPTSSPPLEERIKPWLLNDYILRLRTDLAIRRRPLDGLARATTLLLVWWAGPIVLVLMWTRSWVAHELWLSVLIAICLIVAIYAGVLSWWKMRADLGGHAPRAWLASILVIALCMPIVWLTLVNSSGLGPGQFRPGTYQVFEQSLAERIAMYPNLGRAELFGSDIERSISRVRRSVRLLGVIDSADLSEERLSTLSPDVANAEAARRAAWRANCREFGVPLLVCDVGFASHEKRPKSLERLRTTWCMETLSALCGDFFVRMETIFDETWDAERRAAIDNQAKPDFSNRDLRAANLSGGHFVGMSFIDADVSEANLADAELESATMENTQLVNTRLARANLRSANLRGAELGGVRLRAAVLTNTQLSSADLTAASLVNVLGIGAILNGTTLFGANLTGADLRRTFWHNARLNAVLGHGVDFRGASGLTQRDLDQVIGSRRTLLPDTPDRETGQPLYVLSCWRERPEHLDILLWRHSDFRTGGYYESDFMCQSGEAPRKVGTPWPLDQLPPWEANEDWKPEDRGYVNP